MIRWLLFPPVMSIILMLPALVFHNRDYAREVPLVLWGVAAAAYACICVISASEIIRRKMRNTTTLTMLAQGILISAVATQIGARFLAIVGLLLFLIGLGLAFAAVGGSSGDRDGTSSDVQAALTQISSVGADRVLSQLGLPVCCTDGAGVIEEASEAFMNIMGKAPEGTIGEQISSLLDTSSEFVQLPSGKWWLSSTTFEDRNYLVLMPTQDGLPPKEMPKRPTNEIILVDQQTGLYTNEYRKIRGPEEISRAQRYKRPVSGMLLELTFDPSPSVSLTTEQSAMLRMAFAQKIKSVLRVTDCGFWMDDKIRIQLLLPETPQAGAKTLMSRLRMLPQEVFDDDIRGAVNPQVTVGMYFYNGQSPLDYGVFSASMDEAFLIAQESAAAA